MYYTQKTKTTTKNKREQKKLYNTIYAFIYKYHRYIVILLIISFYYPFNCMRCITVYTKKKNTKTTTKQNKTNSTKKSLQYYLCIYSLEMKTILILTFQTL